MRLFASIRLLSSVLLPWAAGCAGERPATPPSSPTASTIPEAVAAQWVAGIDSLQGALDSLAASLETSMPRGDSAWGRPRAAFRAARHAYKRGEYLSTYFFPATSRAINAPLPPRAEDVEGPEAVFRGEGFQVVEALLFAPPDDLPSDSVRAVARRAVVRLQAHVGQLRAAAAGQPIREDHLFSAARVGVARLVALGITGLDATKSGDGLVESEAVLLGVHDAVRLYEPWIARELRDTLETALVDARRVLRRAPGVARMDREAFIGSHATVVVRALASVRDARGVGIPDEGCGWRGAAVLPIEEAFDPKVFAEPGTPREAAGRVVDCASRGTGAGAP